LWTVYLTGTTRNHIENLDASSVSSTKASATSQATVVVTAPPAKKSSSNTVGIVVGVIVGLVVLGAIGFGVFIFLRRRRREADEIKHTTNAQDFISGKMNDRPQMWSHDTRLADERRNSNGSIADNHDYSRRILQVRSESLPTSRIDIYKLTCLLAGSEP
jgi:cell wall integrity and stress response component